MTVPSVLAAEHLCRRFGGVAALDGVDVKVAAGEVVAVVGPNGSGKTTLLNVLSGMDRLDAGAVRLHGRDVTGWSPSRLARRGLTRTFQDGRLLERLSAMENVLVGLHTARGVLGPLRGSLPHQARLRRSRALACLREVGLEALWGRRVNTLSHGQRRRVELARAVVGAPELLLLDEPTAGLTPDDVVAVGRLMSQAADSGSAILLVEHDLDVVGRTASRVIVLDQGRTVATGRPTDVLADPTVAGLLGTMATSDLEVPA